MAKSEEKLRLDTRVLDLGLVASRERAKTTIMAGYVFVNGERADKPGMPVKIEDAVEVRAPDEKYVSRGGYKLEKALSAFGIDLSGRVCADIGASSGGFTDCMLQNGAVKVFAVDVGYGQLDYKLRSDVRVIPLERTNARYLTVETLGQKVDFVSVDVSFISLDRVLPAVFNLLQDDGEAVCLIKPQFEAGRENVGKNGVVRDPKVHTAVIDAVCDSVKLVGFTVCALDFSPLKGPKGNIEYLLHIRKRMGEQEIAEEAGDPFPPPDVAAVVAASHAALDREK